MSERRLLIPEVCFCLRGSGGGAPSWRTRTHTQESFASIHNDSHLLVEVGQGNLEVGGEVEVEEEEEEVGVGVGVLDM